MGMDVIGRKNTEAYFRNNVWWWRPLWDYVERVAPDLVSNVSGHTNDGDGLDEAQALELRERLLTEMISGRTEQYANDYETFMNALPDESCDLCNGTGKRTDMEVKDGCNKCMGKGEVRPWATHYPFSVENVKDFCSFLATCGGFSIC